MTDRDFQQKFLQAIHDRHGSKKNVINEIKYVLNLGIDAVYRRVRGETILTINQMELLARHFDISIDELIYGGTSRVLFTFNDFETNVYNIEFYLSTLVNNLKSIRRVSNPKIMYASSEIPIFYYNFVPEVFFFKLYVWGRTLWDITHLKENKFSLELFRPDHFNMCEQILDEYVLLPSLELWSINLFDNTLYQIEYHLAANLMENKADALLLCEKLYFLVEHFRRMASEGYKIRKLGSEPTTTSFELYHNEMIYTNNQVIVTSDELDMVFSSFCNPHFIYSREGRTSEYMKEWFHKVQAKSIILSESNEKARNLFFDQIKSKIDATYKNIEKLIQ